MPAFAAVVLLGFAGAASAATAKFKRYSVSYVPPKGGAEVKNPTPNVLGTWRVDSCRVVAFVHARELPTGGTLSEKGLKEGFEEALQVRVEKLSDFPAGGLTFREAYVDLPATPGAKAYTAFWWREGIIVKVQGVCHDPDPAKGLAVLRALVASIRVTDATGAPVSEVPPASKSPAPSIESLSGTIGGGGLLLLIILLLVSAASKKKRQQQQESGPPEPPQASG
jgi:hypothetical protein